MGNRIIHELEHHAPFTTLGVLTGIIFMVLFRHLSNGTAESLFYVLHPTHVLLSAMVTASMYGIYTGRKEGKGNFWLILIIGYLGSVGIATISDSIIPYLGEWMLKMPHRHVHIGFIEKWWLVNPLAIAGILIAYFKPSTKFPHAGHVLISTWASLFHIMMARGANMSMGSYAIVFVFLFLAVWLPCCLSDIVFPLLFVKDPKVKCVSHHH